MGWSSGDQYINELKLMHIEAGWEVNQQLSRAIADCKRSLKRDRGPVKRAPEFKLDDIEHLKWILACKGPKRTIRPALAYAWAVVWMLREIEVSAMKWKDISADWNRRRVSIYIPVSKCDQQGLGLGSAQNLAVLQQQDLLQMVPMETMDRDVESSSWS